MLFDNAEVPDKSLTEQLEAKNHQTALNYLFDHIEKGEKIDENLILKLHSILMNAMLLQANIAPAIIRQEQKRLYYAYLYKAQTKEDLSQLEDFLCEVIMDGFAILKRKDK